MNENPMERHNLQPHTQDDVPAVFRDSFPDASSSTVQNFLATVAEARQLLAVFKADVVAKAPSELPPEVFEELDAYIQDALEQGVAEDPAFQDFREAIFLDAVRAMTIRHKYIEHDDEPVLPTSLDQEVSIEEEQEPTLAGGIVLFQGTAEEFRKLYAEITNPTFTNEEALEQLRTIAGWTEGQKGVRLSAQQLAPTLDALQEGFGKPYILKLICGLVSYKAAQVSDGAEKGIVRDLARFVLRQFAHEVKKNQLSLRKNIRKILGDNLLHATEVGAIDPLHLLLGHDKKQAVELYREELLPNYHLELAHARRNGQPLKEVHKAFKKAVNTQIVPLLDLPTRKEDLPLSVMTHMRNLIKNIPISLGKLPKLPEEVQASEDTIQKIIDKNTNKIWYSKKMEGFFEELSIWAKTALSHKKKYWEENNLFGLAVTADHFFRKIAFMSQSAEADFPEVYVDWNHNRVQEGIEFGTTRWETDAWKPIYAGHRPRNNETSFLHNELRLNMEEHKAMLKHDHASGKLTLRQEEQLLKMLLRSVVEEKVRQHYNMQDAQTLAAAPVLSQEEVVSLAS